MLQIWRRYVTFTTETDKHPDQTLEELARRYGTDKITGHDYIRHYVRHFEEIRCERLHVLEIGIGGYEGAETGGAGLRMWRDYFDKSIVYGLDNEKKLIDEPRIKVFQGNQADPVAIANLLNSVDGRQLDIVIDDGSHRSEHVITTFMMLFPYVRDGGWYVVEDTQTSYWHDFGGNSYDLDDMRTTMTFLKARIDGMNWMEQHRPGLIPDYADLHIEEMHFYHNLVFVRKGSNRGPSNIVKNNIIPGHLGI
jgi:hypothetical protein